MNTGGIVPEVIKCSQCGFIHPKLKFGEKCPMAKEKTEDGTLIEIGNFFSKAKPLIEAKVKIRNIKDQNKFFSYLVIKISDAIDNYEE